MVTSTWIQGSLYGFLIDWLFVELMSSFMVNSMATVNFLNYVVSKLKKCKFPAVDTFMLCTDECIDTRKAKQEYQKELEIKQKKKKEREKELKELEKKDQTASPKLSPESKLRKLGTLTKTISKGVSKLNPLQTNQAATTNLKDQNESVHPIAASIDMDGEKDDPKEDSAPRTSTNRLRKGRSKRSLIVPHQSK